jgi:hypothetical protein
MFPLDRVLEDVNKRAAHGFSASIANILHRANDKSKCMQLKQSEQMEVTKKQLEATQTVQSQALDAMLTQTQDCFDVASSEVKQSLAILQKQQTEIKNAEKEHFESFKTSLAAQNEQLLLSAQAQEAQLLIQRQLNQLLQKTIAENSRLIEEQVTEKFKESISTVQQQKETMFALNSELQEKVINYIK